ncbi:MAG: hypothetical protein ACI33M_08165 [Lysinibacillus sp.]
MQHATSPQVKFIVFAVALLLLAPFFMFFVPLIYSETVYININHLELIIPMRNFVLIGVGFACLIVMLLLFAWKRQRMTYMLGIILIVGAVFAFSQSQRSYIAIQDDGIEMNMYGDVKNYHWQDMTEMVYDVFEEDTNRYTFIMEDGESIELAENGQLEALRGTILSIARKYNINQIENFHE